MIGFSYTFCTYFVRFIPKYFIGSVNVNCICNLNSTCSLLVYGKAVNFCVLTFSLAIFLYSGIFWLIFLNFIHRQSCHLWTKTILFPVAPSLYTFYFFFLSYCIHWDFCYDVGKQWVEGTSLLCSWSQWRVLNFS